MFRLNFKYSPLALWYIRVSILHMFRLNCRSQFLRLKGEKGFNTSYVSVEFFCFSIPLLYTYCFNTSYVSVEFSAGRNENKELASFNTSYVSVEFCHYLPLFTAKSKFQYFICFG